MGSTAQGDVQLDLAAKAVSELAGSDDPLAKAIVAMATAFGIQAQANAAQAAAMVDMAKAKDDDDDEDDDTTSDEGDDDEDDDDDGPGFRDMSKADEDGTIDVTADVVELRKAVQAANAKIDDLAEHLAVLIEQNTLLAEMSKGVYQRNEVLAAETKTAAQATGAAVIELAKAVTEQRDAVSRVATPSITPRVTPKVPVDAKPVVQDDATPSEFLGGHPTREGIALVKAVLAGKVTPEQVARFQNERRFVDDDTINTTLRTAVAVYAN